MKKLIYYLLPLLIVLYSCNGETKKSDKRVTTIRNYTKEKGNPKVDIKVNKRYDSKGNLIAFDSTYAYYYSNRTDEKGLMDSLFQDFKPHFVQKFPFMEDKRFNDLFFTDSLLYNDFFHKDFFRKRYELNEKYMNKMMTEMDSLKNEYFRIQSKLLNKGKVFLKNQTNDKNHDKL